MKELYMFEDAEGNKNVAMSYEDAIKVFSALGYIMDTAEYGRDDNNEAYDLHMKRGEEFKSQLLALIS